MNKIIKKFKKGDDIEWKYIHHLNSKNSIIIIKHGKFIRYIKSKRNIHDMYNGIIWDKYCLVQFEGNKCPSRINIKEIKFKK